MNESSESKSSSDQELSSGIQCRAWPQCHISSDPHCSSLKAR